MWDGDGEQGVLMVLLLKNRKRGRISLEREEAEHEPFVVRSARAPTPPNPFARVVVAGQRRVTTTAAPLPLVPIPP